LQLSLIESAGVRSLPQVATAQLKIEGLKAPEDPSTAVRVFLNCDYLSLETPTNDPHYVGSAAFFLARGHGEGDQSEHGLTYVFDLTETIDALRRAGTDIGSNLVPQVIAINPDGSGAELEIDGKFEITVETLG
jgi:tyrosinase